MGLQGKGVLAIWNGIAPEAEKEFVAWHVREHIPERVGLPGFLRGRRYVALDGLPKYFNFYETTTADDLSSPTYQARLNAPTEWTRRVVAQFRDASRTICDVAVSLGSVAIFFAGSAIAGAGFGSGFQGSIRMVVLLAAAHQRAGLVSLLYVVSYLGLGVPAVLAGFGVVHGGGLIDTARYYGAAVIALAALALFSLLRSRPAPQSRAPEPAAVPAQDIR